MANLTEHLIRLTDHRDRELLELTLAKALVDLLPITRVLMARVIVDDGVRRWMDVVSLDAGGGGKVTDPLRLDVKKLPRLEELPERQRCLLTRETVELAWAGENGPRTTWLPLYDSSAIGDEGVIEIQSAAPLDTAQLEELDKLRRVYRNMYTLLAYSDRDALTGLLNRKSLDDTFYSAVLEELDGIAADGAAPDDEGRDRRHRVPPNYWIASIVIDDFSGLNERHGHLILEEVTLLVARIMANTFRTHDRLYRFGPEQFAVLFHCPEESLAFGAFERLRSAVEKHNFPQVLRVTVSVGFTRVQADDSPSSALERAEQAVDFAHKNGHNRVCSQLDLVRRGFLGETARTGGAEIF